MTLGPHRAAEPVPTLNIHIQGVHRLPIHVIPERETLGSAAGREPWTLDLGDVTSVTACGLIVDVIASWRKKAFRIEYTCTRNGGYFITTG